MYVVDLMGTGHLWSQFIGGKGQLLTEVSIWIAVQRGHIRFNAMIGVIGGLGAGVAYTFVRKLGKQGERGPVIVMCFSVFSCIVTAPFLLVGAKPMSVYQIVMLLFAGAAATGGQLSITKAYTKAPAKEISVFDYSQVIFAALLGFVFLQQIPDYLSVIGYVIIIGSAIFKWNYNLRYEEKV